MSNLDVLPKRRTTFRVQRGNRNDVEKTSFIWKTVVGSSDSSDDPLIAEAEPTPADESCPSLFCNEKRSVLWKGTASLVVNTVGMGLFTIPGAFREMGILPAIIVLFLTGLAGLASTYFLLVGLELHYYWKKNVDPKSKGNLPTKVYGDIVQFAIESKIVTTLFCFGLVIDLAGGLTGYFKVILGYFKVFAMHVFQDDVAANWASVFAIMIITAIYMAITIVSTCKQRKKAAEEGFCSSRIKEVWDYFAAYAPFGATVLITILLIVEFTRQRRSEDTELLLNSAESFLFTRFSTHSNFFANIISMLPVLAMAFLNQYVILEFVYDMYKAENKHGGGADPPLSNVLNWTWKSISFGAAWYTQIAAFFLYVIAGLFGYMTFQDTTDGNIIENAPLDPLWIIARLLSMMAIVLACIPASGEALTGIVRSAVKFMANRKGEDPKSYTELTVDDDAQLPVWLLPSLHCAVYLISAVLGIYAPNLQFIYQVIGSLADSWIMFIMPPVCFLCYFSRGVSKEKFSVSTFLSPIVIGIVVITFGGIICLLGGFMSIASYVDALKDWLDKLLT